jgi:hypothetical protein
VTLGGLGAQHAGWIELRIYDVAPESSPVLCSCKKDLVGVLDDEPENRVPMPLAVLCWAGLGWASTPSHLLISTSLAH